MSQAPLGFPAAFSTSRARSLRFFVPAMDGEVVAKDRPRGRVVMTKGKSPWIQWYTPKKTTQWEDWVGTHAVAQLGSVEIDGPAFTLPIKESRIMVTMRLNLRKPVSYPKSVVWPTKKPDIDNLVKGIFDALIKARVIEDDNLITDLVVAKRYADQDHPAGVEMELNCVALDGRP